MGELASVVIPNWNGEVFLSACLGSLAQQTYKHFEVVLVDNASTDDSLALVEKEFPWVKVIPLRENRGFAAALNEGVRRSHGQHIAPLNNDTEVASHWLEELVRALDSHPEVGICASKMLGLPDGEIIDSAGDGYCRYGFAFKIGRGELDRGQYDTFRNVFGASGGAALYRRSVLEDVGLFDEDFFMQCEDVDLSFGAQLRGYSCLYVPKAIAYHVGQPAASGTSSSNA